MAAPADGEKVIDAIFRGLMLRRGKNSPRTDHRQLLLEGLEDVYAPERDALHKTWDRVADREKTTRSRYAQHAVRTEEVAAQLAAAREASGSPSVARRFFIDALTASGVHLGVSDSGIITARFDTTSPRSLRDALAVDPGDEIRGSFAMRSAESQTTLLTRTHPYVERLAAHILESALDNTPPDPDTPCVPAARCGLTVTTDVSERTVLLLVRLRHSLVTRFSRKKDHVQIAEEVLPLAFVGPIPTEPVAPSTATSGFFLAESNTLPLLDAAPAGNAPATLTNQQLSRLIDRLPHLQPHLEAAAIGRAAHLQEQHASARQKGSRAGERGTVTVTPLPPPDVLGIYLLQPPN